MMIFGEILNFAAYSFVEGPHVSLLLPSPALTRPLSTAIVVVSIQWFISFVSTP